MRKELQSDAILNVFFEGSEVSYFEFNGKPIHADKLPTQAKLGINAFALLCVATSHLASTCNSKNRVIAWKNLPEAVRPTLRDAFRRPPKWLTTIFDSPPSIISKFTSYSGATGSFFKDNITIFIFLNGRMLSTPSLLNSLKMDIKRLIDVLMPNIHPDDIKSSINIEARRRDNTHFTVSRFPSREHLSTGDLTRINIFHPNLSNFIVFWVDSSNNTWNLYPDIDKRLELNPSSIMQQETGFSLRIPESGMLPKIRSNSGHETCISMFTNHQLEPSQLIDLVAILNRNVKLWRDGQQTPSTSSFRNYSTNLISDRKDDFGPPSPLEYWEEKLVDDFRKDKNFESVFFEISFQNIPISETLSHACH